jgi:hypothetical protein
MITMLKRRTGVLSRMALAGAVLAGLLALAGAPRAMADNDCQRRIEKVDHKLHEAIERHGYESKQAAHWRYALREERERCWNRYHRWWDEDGHRWHNDRDWDDHDHDRGHYHY